MRLGSTAGGMAAAGHEVTSDSAQAPPPLPVEAEAPWRRRASAPSLTAACRRCAHPRVCPFVSASIGLGLVIWRDPSNTTAQRAVGGSGWFAERRRGRHRSDWLP